MGVAVSGSKDARRAARDGRPGLHRRTVVAELLRDRGRLLVVTGLGSPAYDCMAAGDHDCNFYLWGAMGSAAMVGLGLASAQPTRPVLVVTGDGEMLMGLGALATIGQRPPANLTIAVLDNGHYGETGMQESHTGRGLELATVAGACGLVWSGVVADMAGVGALRERLHACQGASLASIKIAADEVARVLPPRDGVHLTNRLRAALGLGTL